MRRRPRAVLFASAAMALTLVSPRVGHAVPQASLPDAQLTISTSGPPQETITEAFPFDSVNQRFLADASETIGNMVVDFSADADPDPSISYNLTVRSNAIGSRELLVRFRIPIAPLREVAAVSATLQIDLVDENGGGAFLNLIGSDPIQRGVALVESTSGVLIAVFLPVPLATEDITTPGTFQFSAGPVVGPDPTLFGEEFSAMEVRARFEISPGDRATLTGTAQMVPEPTLVAILPGALIGLGLLARRRSMTLATARSYR